MLFDVGNLITLGIIFLLLILFRLLDRSNRSLSKLRDYTNQCKKEISAYVEEKAEAIRGYGIDLDVERKSAAELMRRIQTLTREELAEKVQALAQIDERIRDYDASLEELVQMTGRVQENLNRIRDESSFVENVGKKLGEVKAKTEHIDKEIGSIDKKMAAIEEHFEQKNTEALEKAVEGALIAAKSALADFEASAQTIERKIEDQREAMNKLEREREEKILRSEEHLDKLLTQAIDRAGSRADKAEETTLVKLRDQAQERLSLIKTHFEEKIISVQETVKTKLGEIQEQVKSNREEWKAETAAIEARQKAYSADWKKDVYDLNALAKEQQDNWSRDMQELNTLAGQQHDALNSDIQELNTLAQERRENWNKDIQAFTDLVRQQAENLSAAIQRQNEELAESLKDNREEWEATARDTGQRIIATAQETVNKKLDEIKEQVDSSREEWQAEAAAIETRQRDYSDDWKKDMEYLNALAREQKESLHGDIQELNTFARERQEAWNKDIQEFIGLAKEQAENLREAIEQQNGEFAGALKKHREEWETVSRGVGQQVISDTQETLKEKLDEMQNMFESAREKWQSEAAAIEARQKAYSADWKKDMQNLDAFAHQQKQEIINAAQDRLDEYRQAQEEQFRQLSGIANDTARLETELRRSMQDAMNRVNGDFTVFGKEIRGTWESASAEFNGKIQVLREDLAGVDRELSGIKEKAFENVSQKLKGFEDDFLADLSKRSIDIDRQLAAWQESLDKRLESIAEASEEKRQKAETRVTEDVKKAITAQGEKIVSDLERLKAETAAFEEGIREEMRGADESRKSFNEQLERDLEEVKNAAKNEISTKIGQYGLSVSDTLRQNQRDLEAQIQNVVSDTKEQIGGMEKSTEDFRKNVEEWQNQYNARMRELDTSMEEARRRNREFASENDERVAIARSSLEEIRREIATQAKLFDRTDSLKAELDRYVEDISGNINRLLQFKNEITHFENQFTQIKRLAEDVNAKMTRFLSEQRRIEVMESDFTRLLQTSQSVEEKLAQVSNSDDILQTMQVQIRRLDDVIKETEEKYQRVERKSKALEETSDGIDRNFKALQEDEESIKRLEDTISALKTDMETIKDSVETLSAENEIAREAAEKLSSLDETVKWLEKRITEMNIARESLARLASELQNLDKDAQDQLNITRSLLNREEGKLEGRVAAGRGAASRGAKTAGKSTDEGAPPPRDRENIIRLKRQGWAIDEIAKTMKISRGEVELILELGPKDI